MYILPQMVVYQDANFINNNYWSFNMPPGWGWNYVGDDWNDKISSVVILSGTWQFFEHAGFGGASTIVGPGDVFEVSVLGEKDLPKEYRIQLDDGAVRQHVSRHVDLLRGLADQGDIDPLQVLAWRVVDLYRRADGTWRLGGPGATLERRQARRPAARKATWAKFRNRQSRTRLRFL